MNLLNGDFLRLLRFNWSLSEELTDIHLQISILILKSLLVLEAFDIAELNFYLQKHCPWPSQHYLHINWSNYCQFLKT